MAATSLKRRWLKRLFGLAFLFLLLLAAAPWLVARSGLVQKQIRTALADFDGTVDIGQVKLGWLSPVQIESIVLKDRTGRTLATLPKISSSKSLLDFTMNRKDLGSFTFEQPAIEIVCENGTTNLEASLKKILEKPSDPNAPMPNLRLEANNLKLTIIDADAKKDWSFDNVKLACNLGDATTLALETTGPEKLSVDVSLGSPPAINIKTDAFPVAVLAPLLRRLDPRLMLDGTLAANVTSMDGTIDGTINLSKFAITATAINGKSISLDTVELPMRLKIDDSKMRIENAGLKCDYGTLSVSGTIGNAADVETILRTPGLKLHGHADLAKLLASFPELFTLKPGVSLKQGQLAFMLKSEAAASGTQWSLDLDTTDLKADRKGGPELVWVKPLQAKGLVRFDDKLMPAFEKLNLTAAFAKLEANGSIGNFDAAGIIDFEKFLLNFGPFFDLTGLSVGGQADFTAKGRNDVFEIAGHMTNLRFRGFGLTIDEPQAELKPTRIVREGKDWSIPLLQFTSSTIACNLTNFRRSADGMQGRLDFHANIARLQGALGLNEPLAGFIRNGTLEFRQDAGTRIAATLPIEGFQYGDPKNPDWAEPKLLVQFQGIHKATDDRILVENARIERGDKSAVTLSGDITGISDRTTLNLQGTFNYNLRNFEQQFQALLGSPVVAVGEGRHPVKLKGPIGDMKLLTAEAGFDWQSLKLYGFEIGPAGFHVKLSNNALQAGMIDATLNRTGRIRMQPTLQLNRGAYDLTFAKGRIVERTTLTPQATAEGLGFALPAIAKSTQAEGTLSIDLGEHRIPVVALRKATLQGQIQLHDVKVVAGPVISKVALLFGLNQPQIILKKEQTVEIVVKDGRVYHKNLGMQVGKYAYSSSGSAGFDGTLDLAVTVPVPDGAFAGVTANLPAVQAAIAKKTFTLKITGTLDNPKLDEQAFRRELAAFTADVIRDSVKNKLGGFLQPKP